MMAAKRGTVAPRIAANDAVRYSSAAEMSR
jgi:hypothetical protein